MLHTIVLKTVSLGLLTQAGVTEEIGLTPVDFSPLVEGQEEVPMANRKPQPYCATQGRRLELWPGTLPSSRDYQRFHHLVPEPEPVPEWAKFWLPGKQAAHLASTFIQ